MVVAPSFAFDRSNYERDGGRVSVLSETFCSFARATGARRTGFCNDRPLLANETVDRVQTDSFEVELPCDGVPLQSLPDDRELEETADLERMRDHLETLGYLE